MVWNGPFILTHYATEISFELTADISICSLAMSNMRHIKRSEKSVRKQRSKQIGREEERREKNESRDMR